MVVVSEDAAKISAANYCAYQERCSSEVRNKLQKLGLSSPQIKPVMASLAADGFFDDLRFAKHFVHGKLHFNKWGRKRIKMGLFQKKISPEIVDQAIDTIDPHAYKQIVTGLLNKRIDVLEKPYDQTALRKVVNYLYSKGFETDMVWDIIRGQGMDTCSEW